VLKLKELEFMIICCMLSVFKIYKVKSEVDRDEIRSFIYSNFSDDTEISEKRLLTWCLKCNEIQKFFEDIKKELPKPVSSIKNPKMALRPKEQGRTVINILEEKLKTKKKNAQSSIKINKTIQLTRTHLTRCTSPSKSGSLLSPATSIIVFLTNT
jgi:hypothetical protein